MKLVTKNAKAKATKKAAPVKLKDYVTWFEIPSINFDRSLQFYNEIYGIQMEVSQANGYMMAFFPANKGIGGAVVCGEGSIPSDRGPLIYLNGGKDLNTVLSKIESAGGRIILPKTYINDTVGYFALFLDTEGNKMALHSEN